MASKDITNQQLYDLIQSLHSEQVSMRETLSKTQEQQTAMRTEMQQQFKLVNQRLDFHDQRFEQLERDTRELREEFHGFKSETREEFASIKQEIKDLRQEFYGFKQEAGDNFASVRKDIAALQESCLRWSGGILAAVTALSSVLTLLLLRLFSALGMRIVEYGGGVV